MSSPLPRAGLGAAERHISPAGMVGAGTPQAGPLLGDAEQESPGENKKKNKKGLEKIDVKKKWNKRGLKKLNGGSMSCDQLFWYYTFPVSI